MIKVTLHKEGNHVVAKNSNGEVVAHSDRKTGLPNLTKRIVRSFNKGTIVSVTLVGNITPNVTHDNIVTCVAKDFIVEGQNQELIGELNAIKFGLIKKAEDGEQYIPELKIISSLINFILNSKKDVKQFLQKEMKRETEQTERKQIFYEKLLSMV